MWVWRGHLCPSITECWNPAKRISVDCRSVSSVVFTPLKLFLPQICRLRNFLLSLLKWAAATGPEYVVNGSAERGAHQVAAAGSTPLLQERQSVPDSATAVLVLSTFVAVTGSYVFGCAMGYSSPAESGILEDLGLTVAQYSLFGSILSIGAMIGATVSGKISDLAGRRGTMGFAELFNMFGCIMIGFAKNAWWLDIGRFLIGMGIGILSYVVPVYIAEIAPKNLRGVFTSLNQLMICVGASVLFLIGNFIPWRVLAITGTIPSLIQLLGLNLIPESPRWLAKIGRWEGSEASLRRLRGKNADIFEEAAEIRTYTVALEQLEDYKIIALFERKYAHGLIAGIGLMVLQQFGGINAIGQYASAIFSSAGFSHRVGTTAMVIVQLPMTTLGMLLMDKCGRRPLLLISASGTSLGCALVGLSFLLQDLKIWGSSPFLAFIGVLIFQGFLSLGMGGIPWVIMSEILPINMKGLAGSLMTMVNWFCSWIMTYSFGFLNQWSSAGTFFMFAVISSLTVIFVAKLVPETKGRTLEEIQASMMTFGAASTDDF